MADSSQNLFYILGSILVIIIILALLGFINLSNNKTSQILVTPRRWFGRSRWFGPPRWPYRRRETPIFVFPWGRHHGPGHRGPPGPHGPPGPPGPPPPVPEPPVPEPPVPEPPVPEPPAPEPPAPEPPVPEPPAPEPPVPGPPGSEGFTNRENFSIKQNICNSYPSTVSYNQNTNKLTFGKF